MISVECLLNLRDDDEAVCWCQPGSHLDDDGDLNRTIGLTEALVPVHVPRGGCVIFHRRLLRERQVGSFISFACMQCSLKSDCQGQSPQQQCQC